MRRRSLCGVVLAVAVVLGAVGCRSSRGAEPGGPATGGPEKRQLRVAVPPVVAAAPLYLAVRRGLFAAQGLDVRPVTVQGGGAAAIPALVSGDLDIVHGNYVSLFLAHANGLRLRIVSDAFAARPGVAAVMTSADSAVRSPGDLVGRTVAVNALHNVGPLTAAAVLSAAGVDPGRVRFVELPFPNMAAAVERGAVDAAWLPEPFVTDARRTLGLRTVLDPFSGPTADLPIAGYATTERFARRYPRTVAAFARAMAEATALAGDRRQVETIIPSFVTVSPATAAAIQTGVFRADAEPGGLQRVADLMRGAGYLTTALDVRDLLR